VTLAVADLFLRRVKMPWLLGGAIDEPAHLATGAVLLANLPAATPAWTAAYAAGCVAVDVDHVPLIPRRNRFRRKGPRPVAHTLLVPAGLAAAARFTRGRAREALLGLAAGTCVHFLRDVATGTGLQPLQPLSRRSIRLPASAYGLVLGLLAARARGLVE
jgi:inner membrane protein